MAKVLRVLIVDDNEDDALLMVRQIQRGGYEVVSERVESAKTLKVALERVDWDVVLIDYVMPYFSGPHALILTRKINPDVPCIIVSGTMGEDTAVDMIQAGANDYLMKDNLSRLTSAIEREMGDVVVRRQRREAEEDRERLMLAIEQATEIVVITDTDGTIQYVNPAFEHITGYTRQEAIGQNPRILKSDKQDDAFHKEMWDTLLRGETWSGEITNKKKDGTLYIEEATISPVRTAAGKTTNYVAVKHDITEMKRTQEMLHRHQEEITHMCRIVTIGEIASGLAHEINQPLCATENYANACLRIIRSKNVNLNDLEKYLEQISKLTHNSGEIINRIKGMVKKQEINKTAINIQSPIQDALSILNYDIKKYNINVVNKQEEHDIWVLADFIMIEQVVLNLVRNSIDAMSEPTVRNRVLTLSTAVDHDGCAEISVSDTGIGILPEHLIHIFDRFFSVKTEGIGIGLAISKTIIEMHSGKIWVVQNPEGGTTLKFTLPIQGE